jgi:hypothetical protein
MIRKSINHIIIDYIGSEQMLASHNLVTAARRMRQECTGIPNQARLVSTRSVEKLIERFLK